MEIRATAHVLTNTPPPPPRRYIRPTRTNRGPPKIHHGAHHHRPTTSPHSRDPFHPPAKWVKSTDRLPVPVCPSARRTFLWSVPVDSTVADMQSNPNRQGQERYPQGRQGREAQDAQGPWSQARGVHPPIRQRYDDWWQAQGMFRDSRGSEERKEREANGDCR
jgi:hypothetical protein